MKKLISQCVHPQSEVKEIFTRKLALRIYELFIAFFVFRFGSQSYQNENNLGDFLCNVFRLQGKTGKTKMKNNKKKHKLLRNILVFHNFCHPKRKTKNEMKSSKYTNWFSLSTVRAPL